MDKLAISNIAWTGNNEKVFEYLASLGVQGIEVAPGKVVGGWDDLDSQAMKEYRQLCDSFGLKVPSFQAFLFGKPDLQLLGDESSFRSLIEHMKYVAELAEVAGAQVLVFGAPKNRLLMDNSCSDANKLAIERLGILAEVCWQHKVSIGLEAVPEIYGGEFITSYTESAALVNEVSHPGLVFHLDTGCTYLNGDSIGKAIVETANLIRHFHISQPQLSDFSNPEEYHEEASKAFSNFSYEYWKCIEMRESGNVLENIEIAVSYVQDCY